ncbi:hypothetical protein FIBSPDRAFT_860516 [Athelia psychrophila]|uniref:Uncharacterized protein n=1 Tax=Athelia psychrophila TaxID=1759441 RepID=A0A166K699_9AGAM|nr:hypothetical protein FIBSPDRAFT_860516 [Fibularhizoctonia sp. CBS 109695]
MMQRRKLDGNSCRVAQARDWTLAPSIVSDVVQLFTKRRPHSIGPPTQNLATCVRNSIGPLEAYALVLEDRGRL